MFKIINKQIIADGVKRMEVAAEIIAKKAKCGQFVIVMIDENSKRIPLTIVDSNPFKGIITLIFKEVDFATRQLGGIRIGDSLSVVFGPLGVPLDIESYGTVVCVGGDIGIAQILPICRSLKKLENKVIGVMGASTKKSLFLESQMRLSCDKLLITTDDGSYMRRGSVVHGLREALVKEKIDAVYAMTPDDALEAICRITKGKGIKTIIGLNMPMMDGFGICGSCRIKLGNGNVLTCTQGPYFDGHLVDFDDLKIRKKVSVLTFVQPIIRKSIFGLFSREQRSE